MPRRRSEKWKIRRAERKAERKAERRAARRAEHRATCTDGSILPFQAASKASLGAANTVASRTACRFLQIPLEIRLQIYGYLFIHTRRVFLDPDLEKATLEDVGGNLHLLNKSHATGFDDVQDYFMGAESDNKGHGGAQHLSFEELLLGFASKAPRVKRHLSILRTNRQVYDEASALLHSDLTIGVSPGYALALTATPGNAVVSQSTKIWRHVKKKGRDVRNTQPQTVYKPYLASNLMQSHVFARFEKLYYNGRFDFSCDASAPAIQINDDLSTRAEDETKFTSYLTTATCPPQLFKGATHLLQDVCKQKPKGAAVSPMSGITVTNATTADVFRKLGDLLSTSSFIRDLEIHLDISVGCATWYDEIYPGEDEYWEQRATLDQRTGAANERATELFLESGVLDPLRKLSNVKGFSLKIYTQGLDGLIMRPKEKHSCMMESLKEVIENNWHVKHGSY